MMRGGADINIVSKNHKSALSETLKVKHKKLFEVLIKVGANIFYEDPEIADHSPFFYAIQQ